MTSHLPNEPAMASDLKIKILAGTMLMAGLFWISRYNYLLFHSLAELFSIAVAGAVFLVVWNVQMRVRTDGLFILGTGFLFIGLIDLLHMLAYKGMGVFPSSIDADLATQLWIVARYVEALCIFSFVVCGRRRINPVPVGAGFSVITILCLCAVFMNVFPTCYSEGHGLTPFKKISEYIICTVLFISVLMLIRQRKNFNSQLFGTMIAAIVMGIAGELSFCLYKDVYAHANLVGHFFKIISFYFVYAALVKSTLKQPYETLFSDLYQSRQQFAATYNSTPLLMGISTLDDGVYVDVNDTFIAVTGYSRKEIIGSSSVDLGILHSEDRLKLKKLMVKKGHIHAMEVTIKVKDGSSRICHLWAEIIHVNEKPHLLAMVHDITHVKQNENLLKARFKISEFAATHTMEELLQKSLDEAEMLTGSQIGFFHFVSQDQKTIHIGQWSSRTLMSCNRSDLKEASWAITTAGVWADCIRQQKALIHNDYARLAHKKGFPRGHVAVTRELTVPVMDGGIVVATLGVGNKSSNYTQADLSLIQELANMTWDMILRKRTETKWQEMSRTLETLMDNLPGMVYRCSNDPDWTMEYVSQGSLNLTGYPPETFTVKNPSITFSQMIHPDHRTRVWEEIQRAISQNLSFELEYPIIHKDGSQRWVWERGQRVTDDGKRGFFLEGFITDITEKVHQEYELRRSAMVIDQSVESIIITDETGKIEYVNPAFEKNTGYTAHEVMGENPRILQSGAHDAAFYRSLWQTIGSGNSWRGIFINRKKDGTRFTQKGTVTPVRDKTGRIVNHVAVMMDITDELLMEEKLIKAQRMEAIGTLAGGIAHDFNNILFPMMGYSEMLKEDLPDNSLLQSHVSQILKAGERATALVRQILTFSRQKDMEFTAMRIQSVAKEVIKLIHASLPSTITIVQDIDDDCPPVMADPTRIHQIFMNLITNAFHAMEVSGGTLHVSLKTKKVDEEFKRLKDFKAARYVCIKISDTGSGMDREVMDRIFNPYFTTKPEGKGTGLGLSVIHGIVESHNGHITVESQPGIGTTFKIYLPCLAEETVPEAPLEYDPVMGGSERILLVDDEASIVSMVTDMLQRLGYRVTCHTSSLEALELFRAQPDNFDLVITDLTMPNMTGDRLAKEIKQIRPDIPIIICTGFSSRIDTNSPEAQYVDAYIHKPVIRRDLDAAIRTVLKNVRNNS